jgi:hypothetical protein
MPMISLNTPDFLTLADRILALKHRTRICTLKMEAVYRVPQPRELPMFENRTMM